MQPYTVKFWRYSGVLGVGVIWLGTLFLMRVAHLKLLDTRPISFLGAHPSTGTAFSVMLVVSSTLFVVSAFYIKQIFHQGVWFLLVFLIGQMGQIIAALVPITSQTSLGHVHTPAAFTLAFSFPLLIFIFTMSQLKSNYRMLYICLLVFELITFAIGINLFIFTHGLAPFSEMLAAIGFHVWLIVLATLKPTASESA